MTGFAVDPDALDVHAAAVDGLAGDVAQGAAAEVTGTGQADFGVLIGNTLGFEVRSLAQHFERSLRATGQALAASADALRATADGYRQAEADSTGAVAATGGGT